MNNDLAGLDNLSIINVIQSFIKRSCIIDFGIVKEVLGKGVVNVAVSVSETEQDGIYITCVLANISSNNFSIYIEPTKGDKVLVVYPRRYSEKMFDVDNTDLIINENPNGYNLMSGIAILFNQFRTKNYKNFMQVNANGLNVTLKEGETFKVTNGKATFNVDADGNINVETSGKYTIKSGGTSLKDVIDGLAKEVENLVTVGSPATQQTSPATKSSISTWRKSKLNKVFQ